VRGTYAISYDDLLSFGKDKLPPDLYREILIRVSEITVGCSCIIAGFDKISSHFILETDEKCRVFVRDDFSTIGEGAFLAQAVLLQRGHISSRDLGETVYIVYEAKRYAEKVTSVGPSTTLRVIRPDGTNRKIIIDDDDKDFGDAFKKFGPQRINNSVSELVKRFSPVSD
jgi:20S proteasome alpha/beta subunit